MGYSDDSSMVRVDFFKPSGKWYLTEAVKWTGNYHSGLIHREFAKSLVDHLAIRDGQGDSQQELRLNDMVAICLEPYHAHAHPIQVRVSDCRRLAQEAGPPTEE